MARSDDAQIHGHRAGTTERRDLAFLQHAQERGLRGEREIADLVEEQRPAIRATDEARAIVYRTGERALLRPEQLALHELVGERAAVHGDHRARALAHRMDALREHLLAGARCTAENNRDLRGCDPRERAETGGEAIVPGGRERAVHRHLVRHAWLGAQLEHERGATELDPTSIGEQRARELYAIHEHAVARPEILDHPPAELRHEPRVNGGHPRVRHVQAQPALRPGWHRRRAPSKLDLVEAVEQVAGTRIARRGEFEDPDEARDLPRPATLVALGAVGQRTRHHARRLSRPGIAANLRGTGWWVEARIDLAGWRGVVIATSRSDRRARPSDTARRAASRA